jgi:acyl transferase domain-containing protein/NADPH:quinone reductase-like Zn-dependent oxidoreductase/NAD(P)-dependent dehydrogenase (short-subunit alcohol dehydrogenase family)/acyl carrier protein
MNDQPRQSPTLSAVKLALTAKKMRSEIRGIEYLHSEPIAIVGMGCRFPGGASTPERFWQLLQSGTDAIREVPPERWNVDDYYDPDISAPGKMRTRWGGFLDEIDRFDAGFFSIAPREASTLDPQQRLLLEVVWEALDDAGQPPRKLAGKEIGVFIGSYNDDYGQLQYKDVSTIDAHTSSGTAHSIAAGRISYLLDLRGPCMAIDTACSSSLVVVHLACQSLRDRECNTAIAGGVSLVLSPEQTISLSKWGMMAADGRCKTFDERADGFVRGEGCGVLMLKRLADALEDGDRIYAVIRGTAVNHDGRSSTLTAPNGLSQQAVISEALRNACVSPSQISYIETHGTGTALGDPIEVEALAAVIGQARPDGGKCALGSVKTNLGHLEAAAGIAGLIKVVLSLLHERIPPHLHFKKLNPLISLENTCLIICPEGRSWSKGEEPRYAGISSFGFGGTNAHVVLEEAPRLPLPGGQTGETPGKKHLLPISAKTQKGLCLMAESYRDFLGSEGSGRRLRLDDICFTAGAKREHFEHRASFVGCSHEELIEQIDRFLASPMDARFIRSVAGKLKAEDSSHGERPSEETTAASLETLGMLYDAGHEINWEALFPFNRRVVSLPAYPWQRQRYWIGEHKKTLSSLPLRPEPPSHPLLGSPMHSRFLVGSVFEAFISSERTPFVGQHRVFGRPVMPAAAFIEMALSAAEEVRLTSKTLPASAGLDDTSVGIKNLLIHEPLLLPEEGLCRVQTGITMREGGVATFQVFSRNTESVVADNWRLHVNGTLQIEKNQSFRQKSMELHFALRKAQEACPDDLDPETFYRKLASAGIEFGPAFRGIEAISRGRSEALGRIRAMDQVSTDTSDYLFHPAWLDSCLQVLGALTLYFEDEGRSPGLFIPMGIESVLLFGRPAGPLWSHVHLRGEPKEPSKMLVGDVYVFDDNGEQVALLDGVSLTAVQPEKILRHTTGDVRRWLYDVRWRSQPLNRAFPESNELGARPVNWLLLADHSGAAAGLKRRLLAAGCECVELYPGNQFRCLGRDKYEVDPGSPEDFRRVAVDLFREVSPRRWGIVHLWGLDHFRTDSVTSDSPLYAQKQLCGGMLHLMQAIPVDDEQPYPRVWIVTRGAMDAGDVESIDPLQAPLWGLGRVLSLERPDLGCVRIDLDPAVQIELDPEAIYNEIQSGSKGENQIAFRNGLRHVARLVAMEPEAQLFGDTSPFSPSLELRPADSGLIEDLSFYSIPRRPPGPGEIEIQVEAVGLNFRDVINALKMLPGMETPLGGECAGRVVRVGEAVEDFHPDDEVLAFAIGCFRSFVTIPAQFAFPKPQTLTFEQAASIPVAFLTAHYGLRHLANLGAGERVLIHAASGGVGLAAVQISQQVGAEIFATAGNSEKRKFLRSLGVPHVMDSRSPGFADEILAKTGGEGVDVVLNSLTGEMIPKSLSLLQKGGRFLEIGKRDIWDEVRVAQFKDGISYRPFDLGHVAQADPGLLKRMMSEVMSEFRTGALKPLRLTVFDSRESTGAFKTMARAKHIGKIVISLDGTDSKPEAPGVPIVRSDGTYLITGGLGALGLEVSRWLCERGARHIALVGRQGLTEAAAGAVENMRNRGVQVLVMSADVVQRQQLDRVLSDIRCEMPPLCGVVHAAGVRDDGMLQNQNWDRFAKVMAPKIDGAWNLHRATEQIDLDFFVLFSSAAAVIGWNGQGSYAAGNAFLDALAHYRRLRGLTALSIDWGPWAEAGMAADLKAVEKARMHSRGLEPIKSADALSALEWMVTKKNPQIVALRANWPKFLEARVGGAGPQFFSEVGALRSAHQQPQPTLEKTTGFMEKLSRVPPGERRDSLADQIEQEAKRVLGIAHGNRVDRHQAMNEIGLDSLMAVELRNSLCRLLECTLTPTLLFDYPSIEALVDYLADQVLKLGGGSEPSLEIQGLEGSPDGDLVYLKSISDADAEALLQEELKRLEED